MNTFNKIAVVPDTRQLKRTISNGVRDVNKAEHFPALPTANMHSTTGPRLSRMSSSFKDVVTTEVESQENPLIFQSSDASPSASPRIGARHQPVESKPAQEVQKVEESQLVRLQQVSVVSAAFSRPSKQWHGGNSLQAVALRPLTPVLTSIDIFCFAAGVCCGLGWVPTV